MIQRHGTRDDRAFMQRKAQPVTLSYHRAPEEIFDDPDAARHWGWLALDAAVRGRKT